ncbi:hypothetical protein C8R45DRAFT_829446 [Mycena sanguinolenta]|nr:hypothetical protein C8R45DRAFT_829446 [Mycena sanguinolenta]
MIRVTLERSFTRSDYPECFGNRPYKVRLLRGSAPTSGSPFIRVLGKIDARCNRLPPNDSIRLFMGGITNLQRAIGPERDQISRFLFSLVIDAP